MFLSSRKWLGSAALAAAMLAAPSAGEAQARRRLASDDPQAQVMGYYAAAMLMTPAGTSAQGFEAGVELTLLPALSADERRVGFGGTKLEKTNFCPVLPRLRAGYGRGLNAVDVGIVPPLEVCGVRASLFSAAFTRRLPINDGWAFAVRASALAGALDAAITCPAEAITDPFDQTCFAGRESDDRVAPLSFGIEAMLLHFGGHHPRLEVYGLLGVRHERTRFDVNYVRDTSQSQPPLADSERMQANLTRVHGAAGASYRIAGPFRLAAEAYYAPGALFTLRTRATILLGGGR